VVAVGDAVGFVADPLEEPDRATVVRQDQRMVGAGAVDFLAFLGQADGGQVPQAEGAQLAHRHSQLALAAIHHHQVR